MTPERWQQIKDVLANALEIPSAGRFAFLDRSCAGDADLRREVEILLLEGERASPHFMDDSALAMAVANLLPEPDSRWSGRRVGAYQVGEKVGTGGMGEVYSAWRADDLYLKRVALKVVRAGQDSGFVITRFRSERQILASLDHPFIARLLDGGTAEDGTPYFVMELIEGQTITGYCDQHKLSISDRLALFAQTCSAVQYAHQRLIIHRDIKPSNILVTAEGTPKLLDFGIAKLVGLDDLARTHEATLTAFRVLTPAYASPEQIKGEPITTASDVYSLGVVLYELLTGRSPYRVASHITQDLSRAVCDDEPEKPSLAIQLAGWAGAGGAKQSNREERCGARGTSLDRLQKRLRGDLDNIVLMALRKEPSRRYASVEHLAEDIRRHLEKIPVLARKDTLAYRTSKFVARHSAGVAAAAMVTLALLAGLTITLHEAQIARQQAEIARVQRTRAERRFNDVRKLADSLMFEIHDSIRDLPGATPARKLLVTRATEYLDSLSQEASGDPALQRELAAAYDRVGDLLGYNGAANLGDVPGALQSYQKALAIREASAAAAPTDVQFQSDLLSDYFHMSFALDDSGDYTGALNIMRKALPVAHALASKNGDSRYQDWLGGLYWSTANVLSQIGDYAGARENYRKAASIEEPIGGDVSANPQFRTHLAGDYVGLGQMLYRSGELNQALEMTTKGLRILEALAQSNPTNATIREYLGEAYNSYPAIFRKQGNLDQALDYSRKASQVFRALLSGDPSDSLARVNLGITESDTGELLVLKGEAAKALPHIREAVAVFEAIEHKSRYDIAGQAKSYSTLAMAYDSLAAEEKTPAKRSDLLQARSWYQKSLNVWQQDPHQGSPDPFGTDEGRRVTQELAKCDAALAKLQPHK